MKNILVVGILLLCLVELGQPQCPIVCSACSSGTTCSGCATDFANTTGASSNSTCLVNTTLYGNPLFATVGDLPLFTSLKTCGSLFPNPIPGNFTSGATQVAYTDNALAPHFYVRVIWAVLFVGNWQTGNAVALYVDTANSSWKTYSSGTQLSFSNTCGSSQGGSSKSMYAKSDWGASHTATSINITFIANKCNSCTSSCQCGWFLPEVIILIKYCDASCLVCTDVSNTTCTKCATGYWLTNTTCDFDCPAGYYQNTNGTNNCLPCNSSCAECTNKTTCTVCKPTFVLFNATCLSSCPGGYYYDSGTIQCELCLTNCSLCTGNPTPCQACNNTWFLHNQDCIPQCPAGLFESTSTNTCQDCAAFCIGLTISMYIPAGQNGLSALEIDMVFTFPLDFTTFPMQTFQTVSFDNAMITLSAFNVTYSVLNSSAYRISLAPLGYAFMVNETVTVTTMSYAGQILGQNGRPLKNETYGMSSQLNYTYIKPPSMTTSEKDIVSMFSQTSTSLNKATTAPGVQEIKKFGFLLLALNSLQITSCLVLVNTILPQNLYEGVRLLASTIFYDVPEWEADSTAQKLVFVPPVSQYTRRLVVSLNQFRFRRTGFSSEFLMDCYPQIILIALGYLLLGGCILLSKKWKKVQKAKPYLQTCLSAFHEITIMYITLTLLFEFIYFTPSNPWRIVSLVVCLAVTLYFLGYFAFRYWDFLRYPGLAITSPEYSYFVDKYGAMLRFIRFSEYPEEQKCWSFRLWFRPYNYHTLSYVKKFAMMMAFTAFYYETFAQPIALVVIQVGEIVRFCLTWPFNAKWRNVYRLTLELILLTIFALVYFIELIVYNLIRGTDQVWATWFFMFGWITLGLVIAYNLGFLVLGCINLVQILKKTNRELMDESRRDYYFKKLSDYEERHERVDLCLVNELVKKGNLNNRRTEKLPDVEFRIEYYRIERDNQGFTLDLKCIFEVFMEKEFNYKKDSNNLAPGHTLERIVAVSRDSQLFPTISSIYTTYADKATVAILLKTFIKIQQSEYSSGDSVNISDISKMHQEVTVEYERAEPKTQKLDKMLRGFPVQERVLLSLH